MKTLFSIHRGQVLRTRTPQKVGNVQIPAGTRIVAVKAIGPTKLGAKIKDPAFPKLASQRVVVEIGAVVPSPRGRQPVAV